MLPACAHKFKNEVDLTNEHLLGSDHKLGTVKIKCWGFAKTFMEICGKTIKVKYITTARTREGTFWQAFDVFIRLK